VRLGALKPPPARSSNLRNADLLRALEEAQRLVEGLGTEARSVAAHVEVAPAQAAIVLDLVVRAQVAEVEAATSWVLGRGDTD